MDGVNRSLALVLTIAAVFTSSMFVAVLYYRSIHVNDSISIGGKLDGNVKVGLWVVDRESGRRIYAVSMAEERLLSFAPSSIGTATVSGLAMADVYLVVNVTYSVRDMKYLKANVTAVHHYERELGLEPREQELVKDIPSEDGTHSAVLKVYLGTLDYFAWLDYYARGLVAGEYSYPFEPPYFYDGFDRGDRPNEEIWDYGGYATIMGGRLRLGIDEYLSENVWSWIATKKPYDLDGLSTKLDFKVLVPNYYCVLFVGAFLEDGSGRGLWIYVYKGEYLVVLGDYLRSQGELEPAWHTISVEVEPSSGRSRYLIRIDGSTVCDMTMDLGYERFCICVYQYNATRCYADVDYVAVGPSLSDKFLDWYIYLRLYGEGLDGNRYSASKDLYGSFGSGEPRLSELAIRPVGVLYYSADPSVLNMARALSFVLRRLGIVEEP